MFEAMAVLITVFYTVHDAYVATLRISGDNDQLLELVILHVSGHSTDATREYNLAGDGATPKIMVEDKDMFIVLARRRGLVVASQVYEVNIDATDHDYLLIPRGGFNVLCEQRELEPGISTWMQPEALATFAEQAEVEEVE